jgi:hypothetical protein
VSAGNRPIKTGGGDEGRVERSPHKSGLTSLKLNAFPVCRRLQPRQKTRALIEDWERFSTFDGNGKAARTTKRSGDSQEILHKSRPAISVAKLHEQVTNQNPPRRALADLETDKFTLKESTSRQDQLTIRRNTELAALG